MKRCMVLIAMTTLCGCAEGDAASKKPGFSETAGLPVSEAASRPAEVGQSQTCAAARKQPDAETAARAGQLARQAEAETTGGDLHRAVELLSQAIGLNPVDASLFVLRARVHRKLRQYANALADFAAAVNLNPDDAGLRNERALFLLSRGETAAALQEFDLAVALNPEFPEAYNNRGLVRLAGREFARAASDFSRAIELRPDYADAFNNRGFARFQLDKLDGAEADFSRVIELNPADVSARNNRATLLFKAERYEEAIADLTAAIEQSPQSSPLYALRRQAYLQLDKFEEARADAARIEWLAALAALDARITREPGNARRYAERGRFRHEAGEYPRALADYNRALELDHQSARLYAARAAVHLAMARPGEAILDCNRALAIDPLPEVFSIRADAHMQTENYARAVEDYEKSNRIDSAVAEAYRLYSEQLEEQGEAERAAELLELARALEPGLKGASFEDENESAGADDER